MRGKIVITRKTRYVIMGALFIFWLVFMGLMTRPAHAQESGAICTDRREAGKKLGSTYSEARVNMGLASNGSVIEVFSTEDGGTFTLMITNPDGITCMMAAGRNWESFKFKLEDQVRHGDSL